MEFIRVPVKGTKTEGEQSNNTTKKKLSEVAANENTLYRTIVRPKADTADVSERLFTNSKKIE